jgi:hypothetical protein
LVDLDGDFSDAIIYGPANGLTFSNGSIIISGINTTHIPANSTRFITIASINASTTLPIELLNFNAKLTKTKSVKLDWQTASEINNNNFTIERAKDRFNWEKFIDIRSKNPNSSALLSNATYDNSPHIGISYYRLKQTDFDGQYSYSQTRSIYRELEKSALKIFPNPTKNYITISGDKTELEQSEIYNSLGKEVTFKTKQISNEGSKLIIDLSNLSDGIYYLRTKKLTKKVSKH